MRSSSRRGFTLIEIMIVVLVISTLTSIAVPNFLSARSTANRKTCIATLKKLDQAKEQWAMENSKSQGAAVVMSDITTGGYLKGQASGPKCPANGAYTLNGVGIDPTCSLSGAPYKHTMN